VEKKQTNQRLGLIALWGVYLAALTAFSKTTLRINAGNFLYDLECTLASCLAQTAYNDPHELGD
jgi:hypothetical protein